MSKVIIVTGSARPNSVGHIVAPFVESAFAQHEGVQTELIDVASLDLPFYDAPTAPSQEGFVAEDERVQAWTQRVAEADAVVLITPEYNAGPTAIQKNAIDWIGKEWNGKPVAFVGYGWYNPSRSQAVLEVSFEQVLKAKLVRPHAQLQFMKDINPDGSIVDEAAVNDTVAATVTALVDAL